jgi:hypothetical protein
MKPISEMNLAELADALDALRPTHSLNGLVQDRLRELHEQTRWIPVSERMPTEADADRNGKHRKGESIDVYFHYIPVGGDT